MIRLNQKKKKGKWDLIFAFSYDEPQHTVSVAMVTIDALA
jgi:hypothetical protein